jgi:hypothetical protein
MERVPHINLVHGMNAPACSGISVTLVIHCFKPLMYSSIFESVHPNFFKAWISASWKEVFTVGLIKSELRDGTGYR